MSEHWAFEPPKELREHHLSALRFLAASPHTMGAIEDEGGFAAAITFEQLVRGGWVRKLKLVGSDGNTYALTDAGRDALRAVEAG